MKSKRLRIMRSLKANFSHQATRKCKESQLHPDSRPFHAHAILLHNHTIENPLKSMLVSFIRRSRPASRKTHAAQGFSSSSELAVDRSLRLTILPGKLASSLTKLTIFAGRRMTPIIIMTTSRCV